MSDPGTMQNVGYSAGSRSAPAFDWVKNLRSKNVQQDAIVAMNYRISSAFAIFWNLCRSWLPEQIIKDFDDFMVKSGILAMGSVNGTNGDYTAQVGDGTHIFNDVQLAPPQGVMAVNYARYGLQIATRM